MPTSDPSSIIPPAPHGAAGPPLGRSAEFAPTGEAQPNRGGAILRRYRLQRAAQQCLPEHRVATCMRQVAGGVVEVLYHPEHGSASYGGLTTCGSGWLCPVCSSKILSRRARELAEAATIWQDRGNHLMLLTLTLRHERGVSLDEYLKALNAAYRLLRKGRAWDLFVKRNGLEGSVTRREITTGRAGWHPHLHGLLFLTGNAARSDIDAMANWLKKRWVSVLSRLGYSATEENGCDLRRAGDGAAEYIGKLTSMWSVGKELADAENKTALRGNETIAQLLQRAEKGEADAVYLYREYAEATRGCSVIRWSQGLRALIFGDETEKSDEEIAQEETAEASSLVALTINQWLWVSSHELRGELLAEACSGDVGLVVLWLAKQGIFVEPWQIGFTIRAEKIHKRE